MHDRHRMPGDPDYFTAVGRATIAFARLEWNAVWCCERLQMGYIGSLEERFEGGRRVRRGKTAGVIASDLSMLFERIPDPTLRYMVRPHAAIFSDLVKERNRLLHGKPGSTLAGEQRLFHQGGEWSTAMVDDFADRCVRAGEPLNALLHNQLVK